MRRNPSWFFDPYALPQLLQPVPPGHVRDALFRIGGVLSDGLGEQVDVQFAFIAGGAHLVLPELARLHSDPYREWDEASMLDGAHTRIRSALGPTEARKLDSIGYVDLVGALTVMPPGVVVGMKAWQPLYPPEGEGRPLHDDHRQSSAVEDLVLMLRDEGAITRDAPITWVRHQEIDMHFAITEGLIDPDEIEGFQADYGADWFGYFLETVDDDVYQTINEDAGVAGDYA